MKLVAQRVLRTSDDAGGVNAYCYLHPGITWFHEPPAALDRGHLSGQIIELPPPGNRVRSYLDITTPDTTPDEQISNAVLRCSRMLHDVRQRLPWNLRMGPTVFEFNIELGLADQWDTEIRLLLGYALQARRAAQQHP